MEVRARRDVDRLTEPALRALWARVPAAAPGEIPAEIGSFAHDLPPDLRAAALATARACARRVDRIRALARFREELTPDERHEVVEEALSLDPGVVGARTQFWRFVGVQHHLFEVGSEMRGRWLTCMLGWDDPMVRQRGVFLLLPYLTGEDHARARSALTAWVVEEGSLWDGSQWAWLPDASVMDAVIGLRDDPYGWNRDELVAHALTRSPELADRVALSLLTDLGALEADTCLEIVSSLTPWLAARTGGAAPRALAELPVPRAELPPNAHYAIARVLASDA